MGLEVIGSSIKQYGTTTTRYSLVDLFNPTLSQLSCSLNGGQTAIGYVRGNSVTLESNGEKSFTSDEITFSLKYRYTQTGGSATNPYAITIEACTISGKYGVVYDKPYECTIANVKRDGVDYPVKAKITFESRSKFIRLTLVYASAIHESSPKEITDQWSVRVVIANNDLIINNVLTVNENTTFQKDLSVDGTLHLGSELIGMGCKVYDMNYEGAEKDFSNASGQNIFTITNSENLIGIAIHNFTFKGYKDFAIGNDVNVEFSIPQNVFLAEGMEFKYSFKIGAGDQAAILMFKENILKLHLTCTYAFDTFSITGKVAGIYLPGFN